MENAEITSSNSSGWRAAVLLIIVILGGGGVWFWLQNQDRPVQTPAVSSEIVSVDDAWNEYHDYENHFSFRFPKEVSKVHGCSGDTESKIALTVLRDAGVSYLREAEAVVWRDGDLCESKPLSRELLGGKNFAFISADAKNDDEINAFLKREFGPGCRIYEKKADAANPSKINIVLAQSDPDVPEDQLCFINYMTNVVWSEQWGKIVKWDIGQDFNFVDETKKDQNEFGHVFDGEISESFRFE